MGTIDLGADPGTFRSRGEVVRNLAITVGLAAGGMAAAFASLDAASATKVVLGFALYCLLAFFVRARPNHDHMGHAGVSFAQPRLIHDANRALMGIAVFFALGRYVSVSLFDGVRYLAQGELPHERLLR